MQKQELFKVEVGVLLDSDHPEFESYSNVYTKDFGFYDEEVFVYPNIDEAKK